MVALAMSPCSRQLESKRLLGCSPENVNEVRLQFIRGAILGISIADIYICVKAQCFHDTELGESST